MSKTMKQALVTIGFVVTVSAWIAACQLSPAQPCSKDADCKQGGVCDTSTNTCYVSQGCSPVCSQGQTCLANRCVSPGLVFTVTPDAYPTRAIADAHGPTWHRDESAGVTVTAASHSLQASSVKLTVSGPLLDGGTGAAVELGTVPATSCGQTDAGFCGHIEVPLWMGDLQAYSGTLHVQVTGTDADGGSGFGSADLPVTREKWVFTAGGAVHGSPAIGNAGTVYFATADAVGAVYALNADGTVKWKKSAFGTVEASPAVGAGTSTTERVYVAGADGGTNGNAFVYALSGADGAESAHCGAAGDSLGGPFLGAVALGSTATVAPPAVLETAVGVAKDSQGTVVSIRADATSANRCAANLFNWSPSAFFCAALSVETLFVSDWGGALQALAFSDNGNNWLANSPWSVTRVSPSSQPVVGPILDHTNLLAASQDAGVTTIDSSTGSVLSSFPTGGLTAQPGTPSTVDGGVVIGMTTAAGPALYRGASTSVPTSAQITAAPIAGTNNRLYTVDASGSLQTWSQSALTPSWSHALNASVSASPNLSCGTGGAPGTLYVATESGLLYAIVSDSTGLDTTASWPKYQHDMRNTGNPATSLSCP